MTTSGTPTKVDPVAKLTAEGAHAQAIDLRVAQIVQQAEARPGPQPRRKSLALAGYARVGKSTLAQRIGARTGLLHVRGDHYRRLFWEIEDDTLRDRRRRQAYVQLFQSLPSGLVVETDDFISANRHKKRGFQPFSLDLLAMLKAAGLADVALLLPLQTDVESRLASVRFGRRAGQCWTLKTHRTENALEKMVQSAVRNEARLRALAQTASITILEIDTINFDASIEALSAEIDQSRALS